MADDGHYRALHRTMRHNPEFGIRNLCRYRHKGHASGAPHRLNRDLWGFFGSKKYAFEGLAAETNAAFCCTWLGIVPTVRHADYIGSWLEVLCEDNRTIVRAASQASKAANLLLGFLPEDDAPVSTANAGCRMIRLLLRQ